MGLQMFEKIFSLKKKIRKNIKGTEKIKKIGPNSFLSKKNQKKTKNKKSEMGIFERSP